MRLSELPKINLNHPMLKAKEIEDLKNLSRLTIDSYNPNASRFETNGDLEEFNTMVLAHNIQINARVQIPGIWLEETDLMWFYRVFNTMNAMWFHNLLSHDEMQEMPGRFKQIQEKYPKLHETALCWAFG